MAFRDIRLAQWGTWSIININLKFGLSSFPQKIPWGKDPEQGFIWVVIWREQWWGAVWNTSLPFKGELAQLLGRWVPAAFSGCHQDLPLLLCSDKLFPGHPCHGLHTAGAAAQLGVPAFDCSNGLSQGWWSLPQSAPQSKAPPAQLWPCSWCQVFFPQCIRAF